MGHQTRSGGSPLLRVAWVLHRSSTLRCQGPGGATNTSRGPPIWRATRSLHPAPAGSKVATLPSAPTTEGEGILSARGALGHLRPLARKERSQTARRAENRERRLRLLRARFASCSDVLPAFRSSRAVCLAELRTLSLRFSVSARRLRSSLAAMGSFSLFCVDGRMSKPTLPVTREVRTYVSVEGSWCPPASFASASASSATTRL